MPYEEYECSKIGTFGQPIDIVYTWVNGSDQDRDLTRTEMLVSDWSKNLEKEIPKCSTRI